MANLNYVDKLQLERLFGMSSGYVLNFSDRTFQEFMFESIGVDIYAPGMDAGGSSKAKRLRYFWKIQPDDVVGKLLATLCEYYRVTVVQRDDLLLAECQKIAQRLCSGRPVQSVQPFGVQEPIPHSNSQSTLSRSDQSAVLLKSFDEMAHCLDTQRRGYLLEDLLLRTFKLHQFDVVRSFRRNNGSEQIDAAFKLEGWHYLVECRWREKLVDTRQVDGLRGQVQRSGKQTMGLFLAINGWSSHLPSNLKQNPDKSVLLMDGYDLRVVLEGRVGLRELLLAKLTHFNIEGEPFVSVTQIMSE